MRKDLTKMKLQEQEFKQLFWELYPNIALYAARLVCENEVDDLVQEAFTDLWMRGKEFTDRNHVKAYLYRVVYTKAINLIKHRQVETDYARAMQQMDQWRLSYYHPENGDVGELTATEEMQEQLRMAIDSLPEKCRKVFVLSYLHEKKKKEIAVQLAISPRTVEVHLYKALRVLRKKLRTVSFA